MWEKRLPKVPHLPLPSKPYREICAIPSGSLFLGCLGIRARLFRLRSIRQEVEHAADLFGHHVPHKEAGATAGELPVEKCEAFWFQLLPGEPFYLGMKDGLRQFFRGPASDQLCEDSVDDRRNGPHGGRAIVHGTVRIAPNGRAGYPAPLVRCLGISLRIPRRRLIAPGSRHPPTAPRAESSRERCGSAAFP